MKNKQNTNSPKTQIQDYLKKVMTGDNGEINLSDIVSNIPNMDKYEIVRHLKHSSLGRFCTGRRGHQSRFQWGTSIPQTPIHSVRNLAKSFDAKLRISLGNLVQELPIHMEFAV